MAQFFAQNHRTDPLPWQNAVHYRKPLSSFKREQFSTCKAPLLPSHKQLLTERFQSFEFKVVGAEDSAKSQPGCYGHG